MVDSTKNVAREQIGSTSPTGLDTDAKTAKPSPENFKQLQEALLNEYSLNVSKVNDRQDNAKGQNDTVDALLQRLQSAINDENSRKAQEVLEMKELLATYEQSLAQMIKLGKPESKQAGTKSTIDELRLDIENLEAENQSNQAVYEDLVQEMKAKLEQRIKEV